MAVSTGDRFEIAFFDVERIKSEQGDYFVVEFGATKVDPRTFVERESYSTLVRPSDPTHIDSLGDRYNGRIWAGHNMRKFDRHRIRELFVEINRLAPKPKGIIDSLQLLKHRFKNRTDNMKLKTLAKYFGLGKQTHRSLDDVRMNIEVLKCCGAALLLEPSLPDSSWIFTKTEDFLEPHDISISHISVTHEPSGFGSQKIQILHRNVALKLFCEDLKICSTISTIVSDYGRQRRSFKVDPSQSLCEILDTCNHHAHELFLHSSSSSEWQPVVIREKSTNSPTLRLRQVFSLCLTCSINEDNYLNTL
ncbi:hypothetical protein CDL12_00232 [Handroanthus impetiginosus]|uniref:Exonuclease domain-containing protein n=1 Tax=Handroanthus impetiginosus TaxID=429701 RepID=A0A2G9IB90_9LAMI|nr:hypothetical protein CDL12_00232 [Handroanthus impetiginosus]